MTEEAPHSRYFLLLLVNLTERLRSTKKSITALVGEGRGVISREKISKREDSYIGEVKTSYKGEVTPVAERREVSYSG